MSKSAVDGCRYWSIYSASQACRRPQIALVWFASGLVGHNLSLLQYIGSWVGGDANEPRARFPWIQVRLIPTTYHHSILQLMAPSSAQPPSLGLRGRNFSFKSIQDWERSPGNMAIGMEIRLFMRKSSRSAVSTHQVIDSLSDCPAKHIQHS